MQNLADGAMSQLVGSSPGWLAAGSPEVDLLPTFLLQMVIFAALTVLLKPLLFDPILKVFEAREKQTDGARDEARELQERAGELLRKYEAELEKVNRVAAEEREKLRGETAKLEAEIVEEARQATSRIIEDGRERIQKEVKAISFELGKESSRISKDIAAKVLGRELSS